MGAQSRASHRRSKKWIAPRFQLKLIGIFGLLGLMSLLVQALGTARAIRLLGSQSADAASTAYSASDVILGNFALSLVVMIPLYVVVGILITHRIAGPVYGIKTYFEETARDGYRGVCHIRKEDEFHDLVVAINAGVDRLRNSESSSGEDDAVKTEEQVGPRKVG